MKVEYSVNGGELKSGNVTCDAPEKLAENIAKKYLNNQDNQFPVVMEIFIIQTNSYYTIGKFKIDCELKPTFTASKIE